MSRSETRKTEATISFRVTPEEADAIAQKAARHGLSAGQFAKSLALADSGHTLPVLRRGPPRDAKELRALVGQIGKIGSNLNQLAHAAHISSLEVDRQRLSTALDDLAVLRLTAVAVLRVQDP